MVRKDRTQGREFRPINHIYFHWMKLEKTCRLSHEKTGVGQRNNFPCGGIKGGEGTKLQRVEIDRLLRREECLWKRTDTGTPLLLIMGLCKSHRAKKG
ncbi:hypothetical protein JTB14_035009 [Gonioctena quinquepunctata]|nr:hypothetical protein JTB14_035009 [Gonioctena quinquepunctata]